MQASGAHAVAGVSQELGHATVLVDVSFMHMLAPLQSLLVKVTPGLCYRVDMSQKQGYPETFEFRSNCHVFGFPLFTFDNSIIYYAYIHI